MGRAREKWQPQGQDLKNRRKTGQISILGCAKIHESVRGAMGKVKDKARTSLECGVLLKQQASRPFKTGLHKKGRMAPGGKRLGAGFAEWKGGEASFSDQFIRQRHLKEKIRRVSYKSSGWGKGTSS